MNRVKRAHATAPPSECTQKGLRHLKVIIVVLLNAQFDEVDEFAQGVNGPSYEVMGQISACNRAWYEWMLTGYNYAKRFVPIYYMAFDTTHTGENGAH